MRSYPSVTLTEAYVVADDLVGAALNSMDCTTSELTTVQFTHVLEDERSGPHRQFRVILRNGEVQHPTGSLVAFGERPYSDVRAALSEWLVEVLTDGTWLIEVPETRARISSLTFGAAGQVEVEVVSRLVPEEIEVQLSFATARARDVGYVSKLVSGSTVRADAPEDAVCVTAYLVHKSYSVLHIYRAYREYDESSAAERIALEDQAQKDLQDGEGVVVEYKPWIKPKDAKEFEIIRTIVAFANTDGGRLYIGVSDSGSPQGQSALCEAFRSADNKGAGVEGFSQAAKDWFRKLVQEKLRRKPPIDHDIVDIHGEPVLCVRVGQGAERPYATVDNDIFIRSNRSAPGLSA